MQRALQQNATYLAAKRSLSLELGVKDEIFLDIQLKMVTNLDQMLVDTDVAFDVITTLCAKSGNTESIMLVSIHQSRRSCVVGLFAVIDDEFEEWAWSCELTSFWPAAVTVGIPGFAAVLIVLKPEHLKADRARMYEEASKVESCPSEIILDDLLALDSIVHFDLGDWRLEQTATFSISTNSE
nr:RNA-dependent RNA polymerase 6 [Tanacetum cinerariifolium]